jgi:hypothetical protein
MRPFLSSSRGAPAAGERERCMLVQNRVRRMQVHAGRTFMLSRRAIGAIALADLHYFKQTQK